MCKKIFVFLLCFLFLFQITAYGETESISASYCVAIDKSTGLVLYEKNKDEKTSMASTTKIMTCLIACEYENLDEIVSITGEMLENTEGSSLYLKVGDEITLLDLIKGAMLVSGNDAANAIAFFIGGNIDDFVILMNEKAAKIGMKNTNFVTPSGLDSDMHYSTAFDMALLSSYALDNEIFSSICKMQSADISINGLNETIYNHNKLLYRDENCIGIKTGYTEKSGRCLVSAFEYKCNTIIIVTLNASDDWNDHEKIFEYSKKRYRIYSDNIETNIPIVGAKQNEIKCISNIDIAYLKSIKLEKYYYPFVYSPVSKGEMVGYIKIYSNGFLLKTIDIISEESVNIWQITN